MTQFVFLLFENCQVPVDSEERYKIEIHFSPGAKGREEIIASEESIDNQHLDTKKDSVHLKRALPGVCDSIMTEKLLSNMPSVKIKKRTSKSLPTLMSKEELKMISKTRQINIFEDEKESKSTSLMWLQNNSDSQSDEELCEFLFLVFQTL